MGVNYSWMGTPKNAQANSQFNDILSKLLDPNSNFFPNVEAPNASMTRWAMNQSRAFASPGGPGNQAVNYYTDLMNSGISPNVNAYISQLNKDTDLQRENAVNDINAQFNGRGGTAAGRLATDQSKQILNGGNNAALQTMIDQYTQNAQLRGNAAQGLLGAQNMYALPSSLEMAMLNNQRGYDLFNASQQGNQANMYSSILGALAPNLYEQGQYVGKQDPFAQFGLPLLGGLFSSLFGGPTGLMNLLPMLFNSPSGKQYSSWQYGNENRYPGQSVGTR